VVYGGFVAAPAAITYAKNIERNGADGSRIYDQELKKQQEIKRRIGETKWQREISTFSIRRWASG